MKLIDRFMSFLTSNKIIAGVVILGTILSALVALDYVTSASKFLGVSYKTNRELSFNLVLYSNDMNRTQSASDVEKVFDDDHYYFQLTSSVDSHVYVIQRDSSGVMNSLYPKLTIENKLYPYTAGKTVAGKVVRIPKDTELFFSKDSSNECIYVFSYNEKNEELNNIISNMYGSHRETNPKKLNSRFDSFIFGRTAVYRMRSQETFTPYFFSHKGTNHKTLPNYIIGDLCEQCYFKMTLSKGPDNFGSDSC